MIYYLLLVIWLVGWSVSRCVITTKGWKLLIHAPIGALVQILVLIIIPEYDPHHAGLDHNPNYRLPKTNISRFKFVPKLYHLT